MLAVLLLLFAVSPLTLGAYVEVDVNLGHATRWRHVWEACVGSGHAALGLRADWRAHLAAARKDCGFERVRFHGLFDDDMNVVLPTGTSFYNIDSVFDFILSVGMEPLVELGFSPEALATTNKTIFHYKGFISPPDEKLWAKLISDFATHLQQRYTKEKIEKFYFEVWNEPNCGFLDAPAPILQETYFALYNNTVTAMKSVNPRLQVGGPATCMSDWIDPFLNWVKKHNVPVDFFSTHLYPTDPGVINGEAVPVFKKTVAAVHKHLPTLPVLYTEYNDGLFGDPPRHDYPYAAAFILKTMSELDGGVPLLSWWTVTDVFEEQGFPNQEFDKPTNTGWGLISASGIPKPSYRAFQLLHQSGDYRFPAKVSESPSVGALATYHSEKQETMVFVWNFFWPTSNSSETSEKVSIFLKGLNAPSTTKMTRIDTYNANAPQAWRVQGQPQYLTPADVQHYISVSELEWTDSRCEHQQDGCQLPITVIPANGLAVFVISHA